MTKHLALIITIVTALLVTSASAEAATSKAKIRFAAASFAVAENGGSATITITRSPRNGRAHSATSTDASVGFATSNGTATAGVDYTPVSGRVTFPACGPNPGANDPCLVQNVQVPVIDNSIADGNRTVKLALTAPSRSAVVVNPQKATLTIADNEGPTTVQFDSSAYQVWESGPQVELDVIRSGAGITGSSTVTFTTVDGTATAPGDYTSKTTTVSFAPGEVDKAVMVDITDDNVAEPTETFTAQLAAPSTGTDVIGGSATVTISDDDSAPAQVGFDVASYTVGEGGDATITVVRTGTIDSSVSVDYGTIAGTATADVDYLSDADTLSFDPGDVSQSFTIPIVSDSLYEGNENFSVNLVNPMPSGTGLGIASTTVTIADDDPAPTIAAVGASTGSGSASFTIALSNPSTSDVTVDYVITDAAGNSVATGTATVPAGQTSTTVTVPVSGDGPYSIALSNPTGGALDPTHTASSTATSSSSTTTSGATDPTVTVTPSSGGAPAGSTGSGVGFDVTLSQPSDQPVTVDYTITAPDGSTAGTGTVTIPAGQTTVTVYVPVPAGAQGPFTVTLANPAGATLAAEAGSASLPVQSQPATTVPTPAAAARAQTLLAARLSACHLSVRAARRVDRRHGLVVNLRAGRACTVVLGASVRGSGSKRFVSTRVRALKTKRQTIKLAKGKARRVRLQFSKRALGFIRRALRAHRRMTLTLAVIERDARKRVSKRTTHTPLRP